MNATVDVPKSEYYTLNTRRFSIDGIDVSVFAPKGFIMNGTISNSEQTFSLAFDAVRGKSVLSVGAKDYDPLLVDFRSLPEGEGFEKSTEFRFRVNRNEITLSVVKTKEGTLLSFAFYENHIEYDYFLLHLTKDGYTIRGVGDINKRINETIGGE
jgi:hypothetical protein